MSNFETDLQAYVLTDEQKQAMHRMVGNEPDADLLLRMLGVIEEERVPVPPRRKVNLKCSIHNLNKQRTPAGKLVCRPCKREQENRRRKSK